MKILASTLNIIMNDSKFRKNKFIVFTILIKQKYVRY